MRISKPLFLILSSLLAGCSPIFAGSLVNGFNVVTLGNFSSQYSDLQGTLAVGGNLTLQGYALNQSAPVPNTAANGYDTVVGGNLSLTYGTLYGKAYSASSTFTGASVCSGCSVTGSSSPINFASLATSTKSENSFLYQLTPTGNVTMPYSTLNLNAAGNSLLQVFSITSSQLSNNSGISINNLGSNATVIINVTDSGSHSATTSSAGLQINGNQVQNAGQVLFNFDSNITNISIANSFYASMLAPNAAVSGAYGAFNGDMVAASYSGNNQFNLDPFSGTVPSPSSPTPEPASLVTMAGALLTGFGIFKLKGHKKN